MGQGLKVNTVSGSHTVSSVMPKGVVPSVAGRMDGPVFVWIPSTDSVSGDLPEPETSLLHPLAPKRKQPANRTAIKKLDLHDFSRGLIPPPLITCCFSAY